MEEFPPDGMVLAPVIAVESGCCEPVEINFVRGLYKTLVEYQARDHACGERAATKAEAKDFVVVVAIISADKFIDIDDVAL